MTSFLVRDIIPLPPRTPSGLTLGATPPSSFFLPFLSFDISIYRISLSRNLRCPVRATSVGAFFLCPLCRMLCGIFVVHCAGCHPAYGCLPALLPFPKYAYSGIKWPIFLKKSPFLLHIPFFCCTFAPDFRTWNDGQTTVKRRSSDGQSQRNLPVTPQTSPNLCIILYYIFIYNIH